MPQSQNATERVQYSFAVKSHIAQSINTDVSPANESSAS